MVWYMYVTGGGGVKLMHDSCARLVGTKAAFNGFRSSSAILTSSFASFFNNSFVVFVGELGNDVDPRELPDVSLRRCLKVRSISYSN